MGYDPGGAGSDKGLLWVCAGVALLFGAILLVTGYMHT